MLRFLRHRSVFPRGRRVTRWLLVAAGIVLQISPASALEPLMPRSVSRSRQFVIFAKEGYVRGGVATLSEDTKAGVLNVLGLKDDWQLPIVISLRKPEPGLPDALPPKHLALAQTGVGLKVQLDLLLGEAGRNTHIRDEIVRTVLLEIAYRDHANAMAGQGYTPPPSWLVEGLAAYLENQEDGVSANLFAALLPTTQSLPIQTFLGKDPESMDSTSRALYRAYSYNLVCLLLRDMAAGRAGLVACIRDLPSSTPEDAQGAMILRRHFPELGSSDDSLEKWWTLGLAQLAVSDRYKLYSVAETDKRLTQLLTFEGPADPKNGGIPKTFTVGNYKEYSVYKNNKKLLANTRAGLIELSGRASPLCRSIVLGYQEVVDKLWKGKTSRADQKLLALEAARKTVLQEREEISDYLNWYEATQVSAESGAFEEYFRSLRQLGEGRAIHRPDAVSVYLDNMEMEFR